MSCTRAPEVTGPDKSTYAQRLRYILYNRSLCSSLIDVPTTTEKHPASEYCTYSTYQIETGVYNPQFINLSRDSHNTTKMIHPQP
jgi:hypothetical protein